MTAIATLLVDLKIRFCLVMRLSSDFNGVSLIRDRKIQHR